MNEEQSKRAMASALQSFLHISHIVEEHDKDAPKKLAIAVYQIFKETSGAFTAKEGADEEEASDERKQLTLLLMMREFLWLPIMSTRQAGWKFDEIIEFYRCFLDLLSPRKEKIEE